MKVWLEAATIFLIGMLAGLWLTFWAMPAKAETPRENYIKQMETLKQRGHKTYHWWYKHQFMKQNKHVNCCDDKDCQPVRWRYNLQWKVQVMIKKQWVTPPQDLIQRKKTPDNGAHACWSRSFQDGGNGFMMWYCVIIPKETS